MTGKRKRHRAEFKARVALEALRGELTAAQLAAKYGVHQTMVGGWKKQAVEGLASTTIPGGPIRPWPGARRTRHTGQEEDRGQTGRRRRSWRPDNNQNQAYPSRKTVQRDRATSWIGPSLEGRGVGQPLGTGGAIRAGCDDRRLRPARRKPGGGARERCNRRRRFRSWLHRLWASCRAGRQRVVRWPSPDARHGTPWRGGAGCLLGIRTARACMHRD